MDWKRAGRIILFIILLVLGFALIYFASFFIRQPFLLFLFFIITYVILLYLVIFQFSKRRIFYLLLIVVVYLIVLLAPWPVCNKGIGNYVTEGDYISEGSIKGGVFEKIQRCECIGFEIKIPDDYSSNPIYSRCLGIPTNIRIIEWGIAEPTLSAKNPFEIDYEIKVSKKESSKQSAYLYNKLKEPININLKLTTCFQTIDGKVIDTSPITFMAPPPMQIEPDKQQKFKILFKVADNFNAGTYICTIAAVDINTDTIYEEKQFFLNVAD